MDNRPRDSLSRITTLIERLAGVTDTVGFTYDSVGRLKTVARNGTTTASYTYDINGNRATKVTSGGTATATVDDQDRLTAYGGASYQYTANGELKKKIVGTDTTEYTYDALGNLTLVELPNGTEIGYLIDAQNRRIGKTVNDTLVTAWLYQGQLTPVAELNGAGAVVARFVYATGVNVPDYLVRGDSTYRVVRDHLGSVRLVVNVASGTVAQRVRYDEFGVETENTAPGWQPFGYAGGLSDPTTGLIRFGARDYDPASGRWTAKDRIGFEGGDLALYSYVENDPVNYVDPDGNLFLRVFYPAWADFNDGFWSYPRGLYRGSRYAARYAGLMGDEQARRARAEDARLQELLPKLWELYTTECNDALRREVNRRVYEYASQHKAYLAGRLAAGLTVTVLIPPVGFLLTANAVIGDARYALESNTALVPVEFLEQSLFGRPRP